MKKVDSYILCVLVLIYVYILQAKRWNHLKFCLLHISIFMKLFELLCLHSATDIFTFCAASPVNIYGVIIRFLQPLLVAGYILRKGKFHCVIMNDV
jgi:hypothetical protein